MFEDSRGENGANDAERMVKFELGDANHFKSPEDFALPRQFQRVEGRCRRHSIADAFLSPFHLNLVVVGAALFVIDFDDSRVVV